MSWESTALYYRLINEGIRARLGGLHSAQIAMYSVNFEEIEKLQHDGDWHGAAEILSAAARNIEAAGADFLLICTNTMHKVAAQIEAAINIPLLHLADSTGRRITMNKFQRVGLLGTEFTMAEDFYKGRLRENFGLEVVVPNQQDCETVHRIIYQELCLGIIRDESRQIYLDIIDRMRENGAECVIEGCTEIVLLVQQQHTDVTLFDTTTIHAEDAVDMALA